MEQNDKGTTRQLDNGTAGQQNNGSTRTRPWDNWTTRQPDRGTTAQTGQSINRINQTGLYVVHLVHHPTDFGIVYFVSFRPLVSCPGSGLFPGILWNWKMAKREQKGATIHWWSFTIPRKILGPNATFKDLLSKHGVSVGSEVRFFVMNYGDTRKSQDTKPCNQYVGHL